MEGLFTLLSLGLVMAVASFLAGLLPLSFSLTASQLRFISTIGMGVLVGTSLIVIIPEGVETLYSASATADTHVKRAAEPWSAMEKFHKNQPLHEVNADDVDGFLVSDTLRPDPRGICPPIPTPPGTADILEYEEDTQGAGRVSNSAQGHQHHPDSPHAWIGVALITGFILMYLIDKLPQYAMSSKTAAPPYHISVEDLGRGLQRDLPLHHGSDADQSSQSGGVAQDPARSFATTTGLVIHAAADGIALGASSSAASSRLSFIIFLAIMVHKAPAAFGLTSILLKQGLSKRTARGHLLLFSLAAPTGAMLTWLFSHTFGAGSMANVQNTKWWTGMLFLFSAGTFLYVAMHTMQEVEKAPGTQLEGQVNDIDEGRITPSQSQKPLPLDLMGAILGMILPLFLQIGHTHSREYTNYVVPLGGALSCILFWYNEEFFGYRVSTAIVVNE